MSENNEMEKNVRPKWEEHNHLEVFGGIFPSRLEAEEFFTLEEGIPRRFLRELYLREEFTGSIETVFFDKKSNRAEELFAGAFAVCREEDGADFHTLLAQLVNQLRLLAETQNGGIKNVL